jgi:hypothetical protein
MRDSQVRAGAAELALPDVRHFTRVVAVRARLHARSVPELAIRARDNNGSDTSQCVVRGGSSG